MEHLAIKTNGEIIFYNPIPKFDSTLEHVIVGDIPTKTEQQRYDIVGGKLVVLDLTDKEVEDKAIADKQAYFKTIEVKIQHFLDETANLKGYDSANSCVSYAGYDNGFKEEALIFAKWRSDVWIKAYELQTTEGNKKNLIEWKNVKELLPKIEW